MAASKDSCTHCFVGLVTLRPVRRVVAWISRLGWNSINSVKTCASASSACLVGSVWSPLDSGCGFVWFVERIWYGPRWNSLKDTPKKRGRKPIVCVAGLASSALDIKKTEGCIPGCPPLIPRRQLTYCSITALSTEPLLTLRNLKLRLVDGALKGGRRVKCTESMPDLDVKPVPGSAGLCSLNPGETVPISVWGGLIHGVEDKLNVHAFNYDWRRWGDLVYAEQMVENFRRVVEDSIEESRIKKGFRSTGHKAAVVGHSMGAPVSLYCLSMLGKSWVKKHIDEVILVAPAHMGSPSMLPSFAFGPVGAVESMIPSPVFLKHLVGDISATWACMLAEMPMPVGGISPWPEDYQFAVTPTTSYKLADMEKFLQDVAKCSKGSRDFGPAIFPGVLELSSKMQAPPVPTQIILGTDTDTVAQVEYESDDLSRPPKVKSTELGDGTIVASAIKRVAESWIHGGAQITLHEVTGQVSHKNLISCDFTVGVVSKLATAKS
eukprot:TRINITY_DN76210_c0_g1_i1.p1 TRINITY_DN76210_c0_g1~~TRINITY_DN76210_c0_g1_i1.p1  ORF type:complete len:493 (+),score=46.60 TRINITY_DN76210_c0_g1_i1:87-1565(+)